MIPSLFKRRSYSGGPHFDELSSFCFDLEGIALELTLPASNAKWQDPPRPLNFPFNTPGWFEANSKRPNLRAWVHIYTEIWYYFPVRLQRLVNLAAMGTNTEMGNLSIGVHLNKLEGGRKLDPANPRALSDYINWEYDDFYESPEQGLYCKGNNYEVRTKYGKQYRQGLPEQDERDRQQYEAALSSELMPTPSHFDLRNFGGGLWTCFSLGKDGRMPAQNYCLPLSELFYLHIDIEPTFHLQHYKEMLEPDMLSAADWLVQHIKITFPNKSGATLALPH